MSTAAAFYKAARPNPPRCIGLQLRPYSLGHHVTLHAYNSAFLNGSSELFSDLIIGVFICSQSWSEWEAWRTSWKLPVFLKCWGWLNRKMDVRKESKEFASYMESGEEIPELVPPSKGKSLESCWEARMKIFLMRDLRLTFDQAMDYPLALAWQEYVAHGEQEGALTLLTDADRESIDFAKSDRCKEMMREADAAARAEMGKN